MKNPAPQSARGSKESWNMLHGSLAVFYVEQVALNRHEEYFKDNAGDLISHPIRQCQPETICELQMFARNAGLLSNLNSSRAVLLLRALDHQIYTPQKIINYASLKKRGRLLTVSETGVM